MSESQPQKIGKNYHFGVDVLVIGNRRVGKSSIIEAWTNKDEHNQSKENSNQYEKLYEIKSNPKSSGDFNSTELAHKVTYWEHTTGEHESSIVSFCAGKAVFVGVIDVTNQRSLLKMAEFLESIANEIFIVKVILANKSNEEGNDTESKKDSFVKINEVEQLADEHNCTLFETSAFTNTGLQEAENFIIQSIAQSIPFPPEPSLLLNSNIRIGDLLSTNQLFVKSIYTRFST